jgi:HSP20 family protein
MAMIRWQPFREIASLQREMNQLFEALDPFPTSTTSSFSLVPPVEVKETPETIHVRMEVPGLEPQDLDIQVTANSLSISGERKSESRSESDGTIRSEFRYGQFQRVIPLPARIQNDKVDASYKNGILEISLPKEEAEKSKVVKVSVTTPEG